MTDKETSALIETLKANNEELLKQVALLTEQVAYLTASLPKRRISTLINWAFSKETTLPKMTRTCPRITETITYKRRKQVGRKQDILDSLPDGEVHHRLDDLTCTNCQHELKEIGSFCARKELLYIPSQVKRIDYIQHSYKFQHCSDEALADKIIKAPVPEVPLTNSLGSASLISNMITIRSTFSRFLPTGKRRTCGA